MLPAYRAALDKAGITYTLYVYDGADHAFANDTSPARYNAAAAKLAWDRTLAFFAKYLGG
jgi:carboxymethylenebutenolidase